MATFWRALVIQDYKQGKRIGRKHPNEAFYLNGHYLDADARGGRAHSGEITREKEPRRTRSAVAVMAKQDTRLGSVTSHEKRGHQDGDRTRTNSAESRSSAKVDHSTRKATYDWMATWDQLRDQSEMVDDFQMLSVQPARQTCFKSSKEFLAVLEHFYENRDSRSAHAQPQQRQLNPSISSRFMGKVKAIRALGRLEKIKRDKMETLPAILDTSRENAHRRWGLLRWHVREMSAKKRMGKVPMNWAMLRHAVKGMTNMERSRQDLYMRYGLVPIVMEDGKVIKRNIMLSNRPHPVKGPVYMTSKVHPRPLCGEKYSYKKTL